MILQQQGDMMRSALTIIACLMLTLLCNCSTTKIATEPSQAESQLLDLALSKEFRIVLPKSKNLYEMQNDQFSGLYFPDLTSRETYLKDPTHYYFTSYRSKKLNDGIMLSKLRGFNSGQHGERYGYISYSYKVALIDSKDKVTLVYTPTKIEKYVETDLLTKWLNLKKNENSIFNPGKFSHDDVLSYACQASIHQKVEINSKYSAESILANFKRNAQSIGSAWDFASYDKRFQESFILLNRDKKVQFGLEVVPYRDGSKAIMYLNIPLVSTSDNVVDMSIVVHEIETKLVQIVND